MYTFHMVIRYSDICNMTENVHDKLLDNISTL